MHDCVQYTYAYITRCCAGRIRTSDFQVMSLTSYHCYYRTMLNEKRRVVIDSLKVNCYKANRNDLCLCAANQIRTDTSSLEGSYAKPLNTIAAKLARSKNHTLDIIGTSYANVSKWRKVIIHLIYNNLLVKCS